MDLTERWEEMTWQEKREARFRRWLSPPGLKFVSPEAAELYQQRVTRFIKAINLEEPDRVPVMLPHGNYPAYHAGMDLHTVMHDSKKIEQAWLKFMDDFGDMDTYEVPNIPAGRIMEVLDSKITKYPGLGLPVNASIIQAVEGEYMKADEYDQLLMDPSDYRLRVNLPRTTGLFESFGKLPPLRNLEGAAWFNIMADPDTRRTFQKLLDLAEENRQWQVALEGIRKTVISRGYPIVTSFGFGSGAPYDFFADKLRGTHGIVMDIYRQPRKLHEAMEADLNLKIIDIKNFPMTDTPVVTIPLHKGDDTFMSDKHFETFYWPYLRRLLMAMIDEGLVPMPFAEGRYTKRLKQIADMPRGTVIWWFDQTDMTEAKKILGDVSCIAGNIPASIIKTGTAAQVKEYCRELISVCAPGGGYILTSGSSIDKADIKNIKAIREAAGEYGSHQK